MFEARPGELCNFAYRQVFTVNLTWKEFSNGAYIEHDTSLVRHINLRTGYTLHERDRTSFILSAKKGTAKNVGVFWHLRTPTGKLVVVQAGQLSFNADTGELIKVTPNLNPDFAAVICPALGGSPA